MANLITYELIYEALRKEKQNQELQKLDPNFFKDASSYLKEKYNILESQKSKDSIFSQTETKNTEKQIENTKKILRELYEKRENKITQLAMLNSRTKSKITPALLEEEKQLYNEMLKTMDKYRNMIIENILSRSIRQEEPKEIKTQSETKKNVIFTKSVPEFIAEDLKVYGPFQPNDKALIPLEIANLLINKNRAVEDENTEIS